MALLHSLYKPIATNRNFCQNYKIIAKLPLDI